MVAVKIMRKEKGFTLVELLIAMMIIAILVSLAMVSLQGARRTARDGRRKTDLEAVRAALEMRRADCGSYPDVGLSSLDDITGDDALGCPPCCSLTVYTTIPADPLDPLATRRYYCYANTGSNTYYLNAGLEIDTGDSYTCTGGCGSGVTCNYQLTNP